MDIYGVAIEIKANCVYLNLKKRYCRRTLIFCFHMISVLGKFETFELTCSSLFDGKINKFAY